MSRPAPRSGFALRRSEARNSRARHGREHVKVVDSFALSSPLLWPMPFASAEGTSRAPSGMAAPVPRARGTFPPTSPTGSFLSRMSRNLPRLVREFAANAFRRADSARIVLPAFA